MEKIIYTADLLGKLNWLLIILVGLCWLVLIIYITCACPLNKEEEIRVIKRAAIGFLICLGMTMIHIFIPSKKTYLRMHAAEVIEEIQENNYWKKSLTEKEIRIVNEWIRENESK